MAEQKRDHQKLVQLEPEHFEGLREPRLAVFDRIARHVHLLGGPEKALAISLIGIVAFLWQAGGDRVVQLAAIGAALLACLICMVVTGMRDGTTKERERDGPAKPRAKRSGAGTARRHEGT